MPVRINGKNEVAWTVEQLIKVTKENIETSTTLNNKMIALNDEMVKLTNGIYLLTILIAFILTTRTQS